MTSTLEFWKMKWKAQEFLIELKKTEAETLWFKWGEWVMDHVGVFKCI